MHVLSYNETSATTGASASFRLWANERGRAATSGRRFDRLLGAEPNISSVI
jgi:hypothetical protein